MYLLACPNEAFGNTCSVVTLPVVWWTGQESLKDNVSKCFRHDLCSGRSHYNMIVMKPA